MARCAERLWFWRDHLKGLAPSGLSREAYCAWHRLSGSTLYRWELRLGCASIRLRASAAFEAT